MKEKLINQELELKSQIINSLNQSRDKWFELLKEKIEDEEVRGIILARIEELDKSIVSLDIKFVPLLFDQVENITERLRNIEKSLKKTDKQ